MIFIKNTQEAKIILLSEYKTQSILSTCRSLNFSSVHFLPTKLVDTKSIYTRKDQGFALLGWKTIIYCTWDLYIPWNLGFGGLEKIIFLNLILYIQTASCLFY